jgi:transcriptional regulator of acetoin/glycerol metabolism
VAEQSRGVVVVTDASGLVLHRVGDDGLKERAAEMNLVEGARYSEAADGTNGIGTALASDHAFQVFASTNATTSGSAPGRLCTTRCPARRSD